MIPDNIFEIYPEYYRIHGPYSSGKDRRARVVLVGSGAKTTRLYAKILLECHLGRKLVEDETVDHIDENPHNDELSNLRILSKGENSRRAHLGKEGRRGYKQLESQKRSGAKNGQARLTDAQVYGYRIKFAAKEMTKSQIGTETNLERKTIENMLKGVSYVSAGGPLSTFRSGRPKRGSGEAG